MQVHTSGASTIPTKHASSQPSLSQPSVPHQPRPALGLAARDLVDQHRLGAPHRGGRLEEPRGGACFVGIQEADEVVEGDQAGVVVAMLEPERLGERVEQDGLARAAASDEQQRILGDERGDRTDGMCRSFVARKRAASAKMARHLAELGRLAGAQAPSGCTGDYTRGRLAG